MKDTERVNEAASTVLGARVSRDYADEYEVIRKQRGDTTMSDTVRAALDAFRADHWRRRLDPAEQGVA